MSYKQDGRQISLYSNRQTSAEGKDDIIYYNFSINAGFTLNSGIPDYTNAIATFNEINDSNVVENTSNYSLGILRCQIPTISIPRLIMPVVIGQPDINKMYNTITMIYRDNANVIKANVSQNVVFKSEILNPTPATTGMFAYPVAPIDRQDVSGEYYNIYFVDSVIKMFNDCLYSVYQNIVTAMAVAVPPVVLDPLLFPFITYNNDTQLFSINCPNNTGINNFRSDLLPCIEIYTDDYTQTLLGLSSKYLTPAGRPSPACIWQIDVLNFYNNIVSYENKDTLNILIKYYKMESDQSSIPDWQSFQSVVFVINQGISITEKEVDSIPVGFQQPTSTSFQKPYIPMLCDFEVDQSDWAKSTKYVQFQASSREQVRLISLSSNNPVKNLNLSVYWKDNFGNRRPIYLTASAPLTIKVGFFPKVYKN